MLDDPLEIKHNFAKPLTIVTKISSERMSSLKIIFIFQRCTIHQKGSPVYKPNTLLSFPPISQV